MTALVSIIEIARSPEDVFALATDPTRFSEWQRDVVGARMLADGQFETTRRFAGMRRTLIQRITDDNPPHYWAAEGVDGPIRPRATITVEPLDGGSRTRATFSLDFEARGAGVAILPLVRRQAAAGAPVSYHNLKRLLEAATQIR